jgi:hypothetical protein
MTEREQQQSKELPGAYIDIPAQGDPVTVTTTLPASGHFVTGRASGSDSASVTCTFSPDTMMGSQSPSPAQMSATVNQTAKTWTCTFHFNPALTVTEAVHVTAALSVNGQPVGSADNRGFTIKPG